MVEQRMSRRFWRHLIWQQPSLHMKPMRSISTGAVADWRNCDINLGERFRLLAGLTGRCPAAVKIGFRALTDSFGAERRIASAPDRETSLRSRPRRCMAGF